MLQIYGFFIFSLQNLIKSDHVLAIFDTQLNNKIKFFLSLTDVMHKKEHLLYGFETFYLILGTFELPPLIFARRTLN